MKLCRFDTYNHSVNLKAANIAPKAYADFQTFRELIFAVFVCRHGEIDVVTDIDDALINQLVCFLYVTLCCVNDNFLVVVLRKQVAVRRNYMLS